MNIGDKIKNIRQNQNLTQDEFCQRFNLKKRTLQNYELNATEPTFSLVLNICITFGIDLNYFIQNTEIKIEKVISIQEMLQIMNKLSKSSLFEREIIIKILELKDKKKIIEYLSNLE